VYSTNWLILALQCLLVSSYAFDFPCVGTHLGSEQARKVFPLTISIKVNLSWRFPEPQALGDEPPQTGQSGAG